MRGRSSGKTAPPLPPCFTRVSGGAINFSGGGNGRTTVPQVCTF